jgi:hypothetical protein
LPEAELNFHLKNGFYFRTNETGDISIVKATSFDDAGEVLVTCSRSEFASVVSGASQRGETGSTYNYALRFLEGVMFCAGCGCELPPVDTGVLGIISRSVCMPCYEQKLKPLFDWGMKR